MTLQHNTNTTPWDALPEPVKTFLTAHTARVFTDAAVVTDEGHDYAGREQIEAWLTGTAGEYTYTTEFISATTDADTVDVLQHLEGDFPGGVVDLHYRFGLDGALIKRLVIEP